MNLKTAILSIICVFPALLFPQTQKSEENRLPESERIFSTVQRTDAKTQAAKSDWRKQTKLGEITYLLRMPDSWTKERDEAARRSKIPSVRGILAICTWENNTENLRKNVSISESNYRHLIKFADDNNLAVLTWQNFGGYLISTSSDEMTKTQRRDTEFMFNDRLAEWERGFRKVLKKYNLPSNTTLAYGFSGGAQMIHRIALRKPQYFSGIHIHVNSSYDIPTPNAKNIVWLVTTGELEYGYAASTRFYQKMLDLGYCVIFKAGENIGHETNEQIENLSVEFFKYMANFLPDPTNPNWKVPPIDKYYLLRHPTYIGDYLNQVAFPAETAVKQVGDRKYMVALPTKPIAQAWGPIMENKPYDGSK